MVLINNRLNDNAKTNQTITYFELYKNTKFTDMQNTLHFSSNKARDKFFTELGETCDGFLTYYTPFNFRRDRGLVRVPKTMDELQGYNYGRFLNGWDKKVYYFFVGGMTYLNDQTTQLEIVIDVVMTYTQGDVLNSLQGIEVKRQHLGSMMKEDLMENLRCNNDLLPINTLRYEREKSVLFNKMSVIVETGVSLDKDTWGDENSPKMKTANGNHINDTVSMTDLYIFSATEWSNFVTDLKDYPWIAQNIKKATIVPTATLDGWKTDKNHMVNFTGEPPKDKWVDFSPLNTTPKQLREWLHLAKDGSEDFLIRDGLLTVELTDFRNHTVPIKPSAIDMVQGIEIMSYQDMGYNNVIEIYHKADQARYQLDGKRFAHGTFLNNVLRFDNFDNAPLMIDNGLLAKANSAYARQNADQDTISGKINRVMDGNNSTKDRVMSAFSIYSDVFSGGLLGGIAKGAGLFKDEYNYYRDQKAQFKQWAITPPTITDGSYNTNIPRLADAYGVFLLFAFPSQQDVDKMKRYHGDYGFDTEGLTTSLDNIHSMSICNWVQFDGSWTLPDVDANFVTQLQAIFSAGVRLFHDYDYMLNYDPKDNRVIDEFDVDDDYDEVNNNHKIHTITNSEGYSFYVIESDGEFGFIDCGLSEKTTKRDREKAIEQLNSLGVNKFKFGVVTHWHDDHVTWLNTKTFNSWDGYNLYEEIPSLFEDYEVEKLYYMPFEYDRIKDYIKMGNVPEDKFNMWNTNYHEVLKIAREHNVELVELNTTEFTHDFKFGGFDITLVFKRPNSWWYENYYNNNYDSIQTIVKREVNGHVWTGWFTGDAHNISMTSNIELLADKNIIDHIDFIEVPHHGHTASESNVHIAKERFGLAKFALISTKEERLTDGEKEGTVNFFAPNYFITGNGSIEVNYDNAITVTQNGTSQKY